MPSTELKDICKHTIEDVLERDDVEYVTGIVKLALFSRFGRRRVWARGRLPIAFGGDYVELCTEKKDGVIYAYLEFQAYGVVVFVDVYREDLILTEPYPSRREISQWPNCDS